MSLRATKRWKRLSWGLLCLTCSMFAARPSAAQPSRGPLPPLSEFAVIEEKNLFHPDRIPQVPPRSARQPGGGTDDIANTHFVLHGVILYDNGPSIALLQEPRLTEKKVKSLTQGDKIGSFVLKAIKRDRVVMALGDKEFEVVLFKPKKAASSPKRTGARTPPRPRLNPPSRLTPTGRGVTLPRPIPLKPQ